MAKDLVEQIVHEFGIDSRLAKLLVERGVTTFELAQLTFNPNYESIPGPESIPNMRPALERLLSAIGRKEPILVWGHEDADGSTSVAVMMKTIRKLGGVAGYFIPSKAKEGHTLHYGRLKEAVEKGYKLVVTVDSGTSSVFDAVEYQKELGIEIIITDHHELPHGRELPEEIILVNPKLPGSGSFPYLAGVGVAFKVAWGLFRYKLGWNQLDIEREMPELLVYVLIGTIADRVPLWNENLALVMKGRQAFERISRPFIRAYERLMKTRPSLETMISIVSAGKTKEWRNSGVELLIADDDADAEDILKELMSEIENWTKTSEKLLNHALQKLGRVRRYILLDMGDVEPRYLGFLSSRLKEKFKVPTIVLGRKNNGVVVAEVRTPYGFNSLDLLNSVSHLFIDYGGHKMASGFSMEESALPELAEEVELYFKKYGDVPEEAPPADIVIKGNSPNERKLIHDVERLGRVGFEIKLLFDGVPIGKIRELLRERLVNDPEGLLDLYSSNVRVKMLITSTPDGFKPEFIEPIENTLSVPSTET